MIDVAMHMISEIWNTLREMAPYLLFGFLVAGILSVLIRPEVVERHLGGRGIGQVAKAAIFGVPLPLCSCGVIPVAASLRRHGAGAGATTSFLISTPQTGVDSIMVTLSLLGPVFAVFRPLVSFLSGLLGGSLVTAFGSGDGGRDQFRPKCMGECCTGGGSRSRLLQVFRYGFITLPRDINRALLIGVVIAGVISSIVPDDYFSWILGGGIFSMLVMMVIGIPVYVCATASVPIAAALIAKGVSPGAALVFLMTGPATNAATVATVWRIMGRRTAWIYLSTVAVCAIAAGLVLDRILGPAAGIAAAGVPVMVPGIAKSVSAVVLLAVLAGAFFQPSKVGEVNMEGKTGRQVTFMIEGMSCDHCASSIRRALVECEGVSSAVVDFRKGFAVVNGTEFDVESLRSAVEDLGYRITRIEESGETL